MMEKLFNAAWESIPFFDPSQILFFDVYDMNWLHVRAPRISFSQDDPGDYELHYKLDPRDVQAEDRDTFSF